MNLRNLIVTVAVGAAAIGMIAGGLLNFPFGLGGGKGVGAGNAAGVTSADGTAASSEKTAAQTTPVDKPRVDPKTDQSSSVATGSKPAVRQLVIEVSGRDLRLQTSAPAASGSAPNSNGKDVPAKPASLTTDSSAIATSEAMTLDAVMNEVMTAWYANPDLQIRIDRKADSKAATEAALKDRLERLGFPQTQLDWGDGPAP